MPFTCFRAYVCKSLMRYEQVLQSVRQRMTWQMSIASRTSPLAEASDTAADSL